MSSLWEMTLDNSRGWKYCRAIRHPPMKTIPALVLGLSLLVTAGCSNPRPHHHPAGVTRIPKVEASPAADLLIISAVYGSGTKFADVTYRVNDLLRQPDVEFFARPEWLNADPTPGWNKALVIVYEIDGKRSTFAASEGGKVSAALLLSGDR